MKHTIRFDYCRPYRAAAIMTARAAVLTPTTHPTDSDASLYAAMRLLSIRWRHAATQLCQHGWQPRGRMLDDEESMAWLLNCRPPFAEVCQKTWFCRMADICPYCYARRIAGLYTKMRHIMQVADDTVTELDLTQDAPPEPVVDAGRAQRAVFLEPGVAATSGLRLLERRHEFNVPLFDNDLCREAAERRQPLHGELSLTEAFPTRSREERAEISARLDACLQALVNSRRALLQIVRPTGAVLYTTVEPWDNCWHFEHRQLFILGPGEDLPESVRLRTIGTVRQYDRVDAKAISTALRRVFAYPQRMLLGDHSMTALYLNSRAGRQMWASTGVARVASNRVVDESDNQ